MRRDLQNSRRAPSPPSSPLSTWVLLLVCALPVTSSAAAVDANCRSLRLTDCPSPLDLRFPEAREMLHWQGEDRVLGLRNTWRLYPGDVFRTRHRSPVPLPRAIAELADVHYRFAGQVSDLAAYVTRQRVGGLLLIKNGRTALEYYGLGNTDRTLWTSRSVAKSLVSTLVGIAIREGKIHSIDDPIVQYLPELKRTAWDGVTLRQLITHTSGVAWNEDRKST